MNSGISSDALSLVTISLGGLLSVAATMTLLPQSSESNPSVSTVIEIDPPTVEIDPPTIVAPRIEVRRTVAPKGVVDFAIIRGTVEVVDIMAGPEDERSGWSPPRRGFPLVF